MKPGADRANKSDKKRSLKSYVENTFPIRLIGYADAEPVAWCSIAPRETYRELDGDRALADVWSLVCLFIKREYRRKGITEALIGAAIKYARDQGAKYIEAYPVDPDSPSYRFMGFKPVFDKMGFQFKHKAGQRRYVMTITL
jgi:GNAT superfamily N-acetyltransferase